MNRTKPVHNGNRLPDPLFLAGVPVHPFESYRHAVDCIARRIESQTRTFCVAVNPEKAYRASHDDEVASLLKRADICICDGIGIALAAKVIHGRRIRRCTGIQLFFGLIQEASRKGWNVFLLGASRESNELACSNLLKKYPGLRIVGHRDGYFKDSGAVVNEINSAKPDMLFVAMGSPRQESWIARHRNSLDVPFRMGVGGSFDVAAGKVKGAPGIFRRTGTEFLYRLMRDPGRWRRQLALPRFVIEVMKRKAA
ncbi:MAG: WecB/TagA/CpsF family glycosyltransferase [Planctomycetota bacterium]|nr:WecB/TagA/CpsF family glycosyltransferase [Planctomycetota bacterium]